MKPLRNEIENLRWAGRVAGAFLRDLYHHLTQAHYKTLEQAREMMVVAGMSGVRGSRVESCVFCGGWRMHVGREQGFRARRVSPGDGEVSGEERG